MAAADLQADGSIDAPPLEPDVLRSAHAVGSLRRADVAPVPLDARVLARQRRLRAPPRNLARGNIVAHDAESHVAPARQLPLHIGGGGTHLHEVFDRHGPGLDAHRQLHVDPVVAVGAHRAGQRAAARERH